jgi:hypothetical protein
VRSEGRHNETAPAHRSLSFEHQLTTVQGPLVRISGRRGVDGDRSKVPLGQRRSETREAHQEGGGDETEELHRDSMRGLLWRMVADWTSRLPAENLDSCPLTSRYKYPQHSGKIEHDTRRRSIPDHLGLKTDDTP